jgi:hypothetical protein
MPTLKERFEEMLHLTWSEFLEIEKNDATVDDMTLCSLIRVCSDSGNKNAIKIAFDRVDGILETPVEVRVPKFYTRYVNAKEIEGGTSSTEAPVAVEEAKTTNYDPATAKLRETLKEMRTMPQQIIGLVLGHKQAIEKGEPTDHDPMVKSIMVANLLYNASRGKISAIDMVFDQIDGKLTKTITLLGGEDVYVDDYTTTIAPAFATKDQDGYFIAENKLMTTAWIRGFAQNSKGLEMLAEGLDD